MRRAARASLVWLNLPAPVPEFRFHPERKWRFDFAWPEHKIAVEQEGGVWIQGRHTRGDVRSRERGQLGAIRAETVADAGEAQAQEVDRRLTAQQR